ncbi:30S ribosomal protein S21 [Candidatus Nasuia deltocephalinicola]|nr:30S ribosomal protein S21 [Candidatus Nasuia deltocephalinicola]
MKIIVKKNESSDSIIKRLKLNLNKSGILKSIKNKMFYIKPTLKKKNKKLNKIKKIQKNIKKKYK